MTTAWFARAAWLLFVSCVVLSSCKRQTDCHGFVDEPPTFLLIDRIGDEGVPYYDTTFVPALNVNGIGMLPSCEALDGLTNNALVTRSTVGGGVGGGGGCGVQTADADVGTLLVVSSSPDNAEIDRLASDLNTGNPAVLVTGESVNVGGCVGEWVALASGSYT